MTRSHASTTVAGVLLLTLIACTRYTGIDYGMSQEEAEAIAEDLMRGASGGVQNSSAGSPTAPEAAASGTAAGVLDLAHVAINENFSHRITCTAGGTIEVSGNLIGNIDNNGTGSLFMDARETLTDWRCAGAKVINGDPYVSLTATFSFQGGQLATQSSIRIGGGFKWGNGSDESCQVLVTFLFNRDGSGRGTGTVCGHTIDVSV